MTTKSRSWSPWGRLLIIIALLFVAAGSARAEEAPAAEPERSMVHHVPPPEAPNGQTLRLAAAVEYAWVETALVARYRRARSADAFVDVPFERSTAGGYYADIPGKDVRRPGVEYYVVGILRDGTTVVHFASAKWPHEVRVEPATQLRWIEAERGRLDGRESRVHVMTELIGFGTLYGPDQFIRGETGWTHRLVTFLYSFTLGYGFIQGKTPSMRVVPMPGVDTMPLENDMRYGYGEARMRLSKVVWWDVGAILGFSYEGFTAGVRTNLVLGRDWRSCVMLGGEFLGGMGNTGWIKLQWDTVPPFLMSARLRGTDLPGALLKNGATIDYSIEYPLTPQIRIGAQLSYGVRDRRRGSPGGGLSASIDF